MTALMSFLQVWEEPYQFLFELVMCMSLTFSTFSTVTWHSFFNNILHSLGPAYALIMTLEYHFHFQRLDSKTRLPEHCREKTGIAY